MVDRGDVRKSSGGVKSPLPTAIATVCISGTLEEKLHAASEAGFDGIEIFERISSLPRSAPRPCEQVAPIWALPLTSTSRLETSIR